MGRIEGKEGRSHGVRPFSPQSRKAPPQTGEQPRKIRPKPAVPPAPLYPLVPPVLRLLCATDQILTILALIRSGGRNPLRFRRHIRIFSSCAAPHRRRREGGWFLWGIIFLNILPPRLCRRRRRSPPPPPSAALLPLGFFPERESERERDRETPAESA